MGLLTLPLIPLAGEGGYTPPGVKDFEFAGVLGTDWLNKFFLQALLAFVIVLILWFVLSRNLQVVPGKRQFAGEWLYDFIRNGVGRDMIGPEFRRYLPLLLAAFTFILVNNWFGQVFFLMLPTYSSVGYAYGSALLVWVVYIGAGIRQHGVGKYFKMQTMPSGVPPLLYIILIPLEILSNFITRPITLALRLFANMFAGHLVIMVFVVGGGYLLLSAEGWFNTFAGGLSLVFSFAIFGLELFLGALQAYIFTVLTAQYIESSISEAH